MSKNRYINTSFWTDGYIEELDPSEKLIFLFLLTNPLTNISGVYEVSIKRIAYDTGFDKDMVLRILERFESDEKVYYSGGFIILPNFIKHQSLNSNVKKGIIANLDNIPDLVKASKGFQRLSKALKYFNLTLTKPNLTITKPKLNNNSSEEEITQVNNEPKKNITKKKFYNSELIFKTEIDKYKNDYSLKMLESFYLYWSEPNLKGEMKVNSNKTWNLKGRLTTWNNNNFGNKNNNNTKKLKRFEYDQGDENAVL